MSNSDCCKASSCISRTYEASHSCAFEDGSPFVVAKKYVFSRLLFHKCDTQLFQQISFRQSSDFRLFLSKKSKWQVCKTWKEKVIPLAIFFLHTIGSRPYYGAAVKKQFLLQHSTWSKTGLSYRSSTIFQNQIENQFFCCERKKSSWHVACSR